MLSEKNSRYLYKQILNEDLIYEHINERYSLMAENTETIKQDLGIINTHKDKIIIEIDYVEKIKEELQKNKKRKKKLDLIHKNFLIELEQLPTSLKSSTNGNSTTGFVVWQSSFFFLNWLFKENGNQFLNWDEGNNFDIIEIGAGVNCSNSIILSNFTKNFYISSDQKGILNKLKSNCKNNLKEIQLYNNTIKNADRGMETNCERIFRSDSLEVNLVKDDSKEVKDFRFEVLHLDWCEDATYSEFISEIDYVNVDAKARLTILAIDVIYNEFLIEPFIKTVKRLLTLRENSQAIVVLQLRDEDIIIDFLSSCIDVFLVEVIEDVDTEEGVFSRSRHVIYKLSKL
ncbi:hypothetical protein QEN19_001857 [Hanseniaspora menglaensis]